MGRSLAILALATLAIASPPPPKQRVTRLKVPVLASEGTAIRLNDIEATVSGRAAKVTSVVSPSDDLILMLVMDLAEDLSMADRAKAALEAEIGQLPPRVHVALLRAQDGLRVLQDPTADRSAISTSLDSLNVTGRAALLDSIETAAEVADTILTKSAVRVAILYITDSDVTNYREDFTNPIINSSDAGDLSRKFPEALIQEKISKIARGLAQNQVPVFIVQTIYRSNRLNEAYMNGLRQLALTTGGVALVCRSIAEIPVAIKDALASIRNHYSVTLEVPRLQERSVEVRLAISGPDGARNDLAHRSRFDLKKD